ncbi:hypothetical protein GGI23_004705 [Coemansia sp. RSA 2559]|nr:hypothetical protein GGI23_004705 [Coemansia sp. RSA 2559]
MADPKQVPDELKEILPFIQRAHEVAKVDPVVSYFCKYYAVRRAIGKSSREEESQAYLARLMDQLELEKGQLEGHESMKDDETASAHCSLFALRIFLKADAEDREGRAGKATARNFIVASQFLQIVTSFGDPLPEGISEKIKYAKWRAAEILKAIREGRPPVPPAPSGGGLDGSEQVDVAADAMAASSANAASPLAAATDANADILGWPSPPNVSSPPAAGPQPWTGAREPSNYPTVSSPPQQGFYTQPPPPPQMQMNSSQFDSLPSVPPHSSFQQANTSTQQRYGAHTNASPSLDQQPHGGPTPGGHSVSPQYHQDGPASSTSTTVSAIPPSAAAFIPVPASSLPSQMNPDEFVLDPTVAKNAQKHARWAISALEYDDVATSIENLQKAIQILAPYRK